MTNNEHFEIRQLNHQVAELRRASEVHKAASAFFAPELDRPATKRSPSLTLAAISSGSSSSAVCCGQQSTGSHLWATGLPGPGRRRTGRSATSCSLMSSRPCTGRTTRPTGQQDALGHETPRLVGWARADPSVDEEGRPARGAARQAGIHHHHRPSCGNTGELVQRRFTAEAPNRARVADITFMRTWQGFCFTAFVTDAATKAIKVRLCPAVRRAPEPSR